MAKPGDYLAQLKKLYTDLSLRQKVIAGIAAAVVLLGFGAMFFFINAPTYKTLYSDLDQKDAAEVVQWLKKEGVPYKISQGGSTVKVPKDRIYELRLALAGAGLPRSSGVGFELFDKTNLGTTDFVQKVNYQRALQGELEKTIARFPEVKSVRVHIAIPKDSLFVSQKQEPTASVVLELKRGRELSRVQIKAIVHLVACAVPRLHKEDISVVDTTGNVLYEYKSDTGDPLKAQADLRLSYQRRLEEYFKHKIQTMLDDALGAQKAVVRVSALVDFDQVKTSEDKFDPDTAAIRSEQKSEETLKEESLGGVPGVKGALADKLQGNVGEAKSAPVVLKKKETTNYEISRVQRQILGSIGSLKRLSVAVMVDGKYVKEKDKTVYKPRTPEEIAGLEQIVKAAMGFSDERGDEVSVVNVPFSERRVQESVLDRSLDIFSRFVRPIANLVLALIFIFAVLKPLLNRFVLKPPEEIEPVESPALEGAVAEGGVPAPPAFEPVPDVTGELRDLASEYPERAAALIKVWLREKQKESKENAENT